MSLTRCPQRLSIPSPLAPLVLPNSAPFSRPHKQRIHLPRVLTTSAAIEYTRFRRSLNSSSSIPSITHKRFRHRPSLDCLSRTFAMTHSHSHAGHSHHHDNTYLVSKNKNDAGVRITRIGLYSNLGMALAKGIGGYIFSSQAMIADAAHSLSDLTSDILTLATLSWSLKPPTPSFPTGFGKVESLGALGVSAMLLGGGLFMCMNSCEILYAHWMLDAHAAAHVVAHAHAHGHSHAAITPSLNAAWLAAGTVAIKEWLYQATMKVARDRRSSVLASNAVHHRVDSLTGIVTLFAILGANFLHNAAWLDPVGGLLISLLVMKAGWGNTVASLYELADKGIDEDVKTSVLKVAQRSLTELKDGGEIEIRQVQGVKSGQNYLIDLELAVPKDWTIEDTVEVEHAVRSMVGSKVRGVRRVKLRFVPKNDSQTTFYDEFISGEVSPRSSPEPEPEHNHNHDHDHNHNQNHSEVNGDSKKKK